MTVESRKEAGHLLVALEAAELLFSVADRGGNPSHDHLTVAPATHVVREVSNRPVEVLDGIRRSQRAVERPATGSRDSVSVSAGPSRNEPAAPGCSRSRERARRPSWRSARGVRLTACRCLRAGHRSGGDVATDARETIDPFLEASGPPDECRDLMTRVQSLPDNLDAGLAVRSDDEELHGDPGYRCG